MKKKNKVKEIMFDFRVNRYLDNDDLYNRLVQGYRRDEIKQKDLMNDLSIIKLNSTFLEVTDAHYKDRGFVSLVVLFFFVLEFYFLVDMLFLSSIYEWFGVTLSLSLLIMTPFFLKFECFIYTHYPIRFNRKKQLVHLFRINGEVQTVPWKDIYFAMRREKPDGLTPNMWYLCGHLLAEDGITVIDTFTVSMYAPKKIYVLRFWELIRRYMEDKNGVKEVADISSWFLPINERKEPFGIGLWMLTMRCGFIGSIIMLPVNIAHAAARWLTFQTSKIPQWTPEVEALCHISEYDPYNFDCHSVDMKWRWRYLLFWRYKYGIAVTGRRWKR